MNAMIDLAESEEDLRMVARMRYAVTVDEMGLCMKHARPADRSVVEPLDDSSYVLIARVDGVPAATMRSSLVAQSDIGFYHHGYGIDQLVRSVKPESISISTRLVVMPEFRGFDLAPLMQTAAFRLLKALNITHDVIDSRKRLVPYFRKLGYCPHIGDYEHPEFGDVFVQLIELQNSVHLQKVRSPFLTLRPQVSERLEAVMQNAGRPQSRGKQAAVALR